MLVQMSVAAECQSAACHYILHGIEKDVQQLPDIAQRHFLAMDKIQDIAGTGADGFKSCCILCSSCLVFDIGLNIGQPLNGTE